MAKEARPALLRYGFVLILTTLATLLRLGLDPVLGKSAPYAAFVVATALAAWYAGLIPALLTVVAGLFIALYLWVLPAHSMANANTSLLINVIPYLFICVAISLLIESTRRARQRVEVNAAALNESRKLLSTTLGSIGDAVIATDMQGRVTFMNSVAASLTGWTRHEARDKPIEEIFIIVNEQSREPVESPVARALRDGSIVEPVNHTALIKKDGTEIPIEDSGGPIKDDQGNLSGVVLIFRDVSERRNAENALRRSRERLDLILEASGVGFWYCDLPFNELVWDVRSKAHFGLSPEASATLKTFYERLHPDDRVPVRQSIDRALTEHNPYDVDYRTIGLDGQVRWVHALGRTFYDNDGAPIRFDGITIDVTERKRTEAALSESQARFRTMADSAPVLVWMSGTDALRTFFNQPWLDFTGRTMKQELGQGWAEGIYADDLQRCLDTYFSAFDARQPFKLEYRLRRYDGQHRWVFDHGIPLFTSAGEFTGFIGSSIDITERKQAEDAMAFVVSIVDSSDDAIIGKRLDGQIVSWNAGAERLYGYRAEEVIGKHIRLLAEPGHDDIDSLLEQLDSSKVIHHYETVRLKKNGEAVEVALTISPIKDPEGKLTGASTIARDITERKRAEQERERLIAEIENQRTRLNNIVANVPGVVWEAWGQPDAATQRINFVSDYVQTMLGYSVEEWLQTPNFWLSIVLDEDRQQAAHIAAANFASGQGGTNQFRWQAKDGRLLWVESRDVVIFDEQGRPAGMRGVTMDISARKRAEEERTRFLAGQQAHSERLQKLAESALAINSASSLDAVIQIVTEQARLIIAAHQSLTSLVINQNWAHAINVASLSDKYADWRSTPEPLDGSGIYAQVCETNQPLRMTQAELEAHPAWRGVGAAANLPPMRGWLAAPLVGRDGRNLGLIQLSDKLEDEFTPEDESILVQLAQMGSVALENQRLIIAEQAARAIAETGEQRSRFLAEASAALALSLDYEATLRSLARLAVPQLADWCAVYMVEDGQPLKQLALTHIDPAKVAWAEELTLRYPLDSNATVGAPNVLRTGKSEYYPEIDETLLVKSARDESHLHLLRKAGMKSAMIVPLRVRNRTLGVITLVISESNRHYTAADLALAEDLTRRAALAVDNAMLFTEAHRARAQAEEANRMKDEFLATVSHELRTPLNAIVGWSHMLRTRSFDDATTVRALETIERNAKSQAQIVEDILDVSRIITGKLRLDVQPVDLASIIDAALDSIRPAAEAKEIRVQAIVDPRAGPVAGDINRLQQVVWNLLANAVKFTPKNGRIQVRLERVDSYVEIVVADTGQGMQADLLPFVFDRFRQGDSTSTRLHGGLGLGLAIVRHLVELHGGTVTAASEGEDCGSTFTVELPLMALHSERYDSGRVHPTASTALPIAEAPNLAGIKVLIVDDEPDTREMLQTIIEQFGAQVKTCMSSREALSVFNEWPPDVIVSDIEMPGEDGYQLMQQIRRLAPEQGGKTPAVALTAYARVDDRMRALSAGYQMHVAKPADPIELAAVIASLAGRRDDNLNS